MCPRNSVGRDLSDRNLTRPIVLRVVLAVLSALMTGEIAVRWIDVREPVSLYIPSTNPRLVYELNPHHPEINTFGMRGDALDVDALAGKYIIAAIGDSHTYSLAVDEARDAVPQQLERALNQLLGREQVKVLNLGVPGYNMAQELEVLQAKALPRHPHLIILQYCINDTHVCNYIQPEHPWLNQLIHHSHLFVFLWKHLLYSDFGKRHFLNAIGLRIPDGLLFEKGLVGTLKSDVPGEVQAHRGHPARTPVRVPARYHYMLGRDNWERRVREFASICQHAGIPLLATGFIDAEDRTVFLRAGADVYSFSDIMTREQMKQYGYDPERTYTHFDADGLALIGEALARFVGERYGDAIERESGDGIREQSRIHEDRNPLSGSRAVRDRRQPRRRDAPQLFPVLRGVR